MTKARAGLYRSSFYALLFALTAGACTSQIRSTPEGASAPAEVTSSSSAPGSYSTSTPTSAPAPEKVSEPRVTLQQLFEARVFFRASLESENLCRIPQEQLARIPQLVEGMIQSRYDRSVDADWSILKDAERIRTCGSRCDCEVLVEYGERISSLQPEHLRAYDVARAASAKMKSGDYLACAKKSLWICESELLKFLREQAAE